MPIVSSVSPGTKSTECGSEEFRVEVRKRDRMAAVELQTALEARREGFGRHDEVVINAYSVSV